MKKSQETRGRNGLDVTAYHEAGHVVAANLVGIAVAKVSILLENNCLGHVEFAFTPEQHSRIAEGEREILRSLTIIDLGGMAADYGHWKRSPDAQEDEAPTGNLRGYDKSASAL